MIRKSPYQGLAPFTEADAAYFFGREREIRLIVANLYASPLTLLYGASGVGKTSVLRAGVLPSLRDRDDVIPIFFNRWQTKPLDSLRATVLDACRRFQHDLREPESSLCLTDAISDLAEQFDGRLMIILDQFDEALFYLKDDPASLHQIGSAISEAGPYVKYLLSIREDALSKLDAFEDLIPNLFDNFLRVEHLNLEDARIAITKPLDRFSEEFPNGQFKIDKELVDAVVDQIGSGQVSLHAARRMRHESAHPSHSAIEVEAVYLQLVMDRLWEATAVQGGRHLRLETLRQLGGAKEIVGSHLDDVVTVLTTEEQRVAAEIFGYLITPGGSKIAHAAEDLADYTHLDMADVSGVLKKLTDKRILKPVDTRFESQETKYEISHDVLGPAIADRRRRYLLQREANRRHRRLRMIIGALAVVVLVAISFAIRQGYDLRIARANLALLKADPLVVVMGRHGETATRRLVMGWVPRKWKPGLTYQLVVEQDGKEQLENLWYHRKVEQKRFGKLRWRVRAIWEDGGETKWTRWQAVRHYQTAWQRICETGVINVGVGKSDELFLEYLPKTRSVRGAEIDFLKSSLEKALKQEGCMTDKVKVIPTVVDFHQLLGLLKEDQRVDILASRITITPKREKTLLFTEPTIEYSQSILKRKGESAFVDGELKLRRLGAQYGTTNETLARKLLKVSDYKVMGPEGVDSPPRLPDGPSLVLWYRHEPDFRWLEALKSGLFDGIVVDRPFGLRLKRQRPDFKDKLDVEDVPLKDHEDKRKDRIAFAARREDTRLVKNLNRAMEQSPEKKRFQEQMLSARAD